MKTGEVLDVAEQVASALAAAHEAGIIHRDLEPETQTMATSPDSPPTRRIGPAP